MEDGPVLLVLLVLFVFLVLLADCQTAKMGLCSGDEDCPVIESTVQVKAGHLAKFRSKLEGEEGSLTKRSSLLFSEIKLAST